MAGNSIRLYRNYNVSDDTSNSNYKAGAVFPSIATLGWEREGYTIKEWNTSRAGTGLGYAPNAYPDSMGGTYYVIWQTENPKIARITLPSGTTYDIKDADAQEKIDTIMSSLTSALKYVGVTTTELYDGAVASVITIDGDSHTAAPGDVAIYGDKEFIYNGSAWNEFGDTGSLRALAFKDSASGSYTPAGTVSKPTFTGSPSSVTITINEDSSGNYTPSGTVSQPTFSGSQLTSSGNFTPEGGVSVVASGSENKTATVSSTSGTATYTPGGSVSAPTISVATAGSTTIVNSITDVGTLPVLTTTVANENLTIGFSQGTLPTKGSNTTVKTGDAAYSASQPAFTGTGVRLVTGNIPVPSEFSATFTGTEGSVSVTGTPSGTVSQPTFSGTKVNVSGSTTATGDVSQPTFSGTAATITVS